MEGDEGCACEWRFPKKSEEGIESSGIGVLGTCEPPYMNAGS